MSVISMRLAVEAVPGEDTDVLLHGGPVVSHSEDASF